MTATAIATTYHVRALRYVGRSLAPAASTRPEVCDTTEQAIDAAVALMQTILAKHPGDVARYVDPIAQAKGYTPTDYVAWDLPGGWVVGIEAVA